MFNGLLETESKKVVPPIAANGKSGIAMLADLVELVYQGQVKQRDAYLTLRPGAPVNHWVNCFWQLTVDKGEFFYRSMPDNCVDWIFNLNNPEESFIVAPFTSAIEFSITGPVSYFGIRFRSLGYQGLIDIPVGEWGAQANGVDAASLVRKFILEKMFETVDQPMQFNARCALISSVLLGEFKYPAVDRRLARFIMHVFQRRAGGFDSREPGSIKFGISTRQLRRLSQLYLGLSPKDFMKAARFQATLHLMNITKGDHNVWGQHYYDQSHYIREFKSLTGTTPGTFVKMSVLYNKALD